MQLISLRPTRIDELGLRRAIDSWTTLAAITGLAFLAMLVGAGWISSNDFTRDSICDCESAATILIPSGSEPQGASGDTKIEFLLMGLQGVEWVRALTDEQIEDLLRRWLGKEIMAFFVPLPTVISVHITGGGGSVAALTERLAQQAPGSIVRISDTLRTRLRAFARCIELFARVTLIVVVTITTTVTVMTTHSALARRRDLIDLVHQLGASDGYIACRFANRGLAPYFMAGIIGGQLALSVVFTFAVLLSPLSIKGLAGILTVDAAFSLLPASVLFLPLALSLMIAIIGYGTTQFTVRIWLLRLL